MVLYFNIQVTYGTKTDRFKCSSRREFMSKAAQFCNLNTTELELFEVNKGKKKLISLNDVADKMKIEIRRKGVELSLNDDESGEETPPNTEKLPPISNLLQKLHDNSQLNGLERKFLASHMDSYYRHVSSKRKRNSDSSCGTSNKKVQVNLGDLKQTASTYTQTDLCSRPSTSETSSKDLMYQSKRLAAEEKKDPSIVCEIMNKTFDKRRNFIFIKNPIVAHVKQQYPLLFSFSEVRNELNRIFYDGKDKEFLDNIEKYAATILNLVDEDDPLLKTIKQKIDTSTTAKQKQYATEVGALLMVSNLVNEKRIFLNTEDEPGKKDDFPHIEAPCKVSQLFFDNHIYNIFVEGHKLCDATDFKEAILYLISSYFIFNISYPSQCFNTFVVMERVFLVANDTDGNEIEDNTQQIIKLIHLKTKSIF